MNKKKTGYRIVRLLLTLGFLAGITVIAVYPFQNRSLELKIVTGDGVYTEYVGSAAIADGECNRLEVSGKEAVSIKKIQIYGQLKSVLLKELSYSEVASYIDNVESGEVRWLDNCIEVTGRNNIIMYMNYSYQKILHRLSASFFQERILLMELLVILVAVGFVICSAIEERNTENNWNNHGPIYEAGKFFRDIKKYRQYMIYAAKTDLKAEVANSYLNRLWWLLEPLFNMLVYVIVFGNVMGNSVENYPCFVFSALLMWNFFNKTINYSVKLVRNNRDIVTKVYIPKFVLLISNMILNMFKLLFSMIVLIIMMVIFKVHVGLSIFLIIPAYLVMILLGFGFGMIFMHFGVYVDDLSYAVGILMNMLMFLSGIFYNVMTTLPEPLNSMVMCLNPAASFVDTMRNALLYNTVANLPILSVWFLISIILCCVGVHIVYKNENSYVKVV